MRIASCDISRPFVRALFLLILINLIVEQDSFAQSRQQRIGMKVTDLALPDTAGIIQRLSAQKGKVVLIDFWASWCGPCRKANPALKKIYAQYRTRNFEIYGISLDQSAAAWRRAIIIDNLQWVQVNDRGEAGEERTASWEINYIPTSFLLNAEGKIVKVNPTPAQLRSYLKKHLQ